MFYLLILFILERDLATAIFFFLLAGALVICLLIFALDMLIFYLYLAVFFAIFLGCLTNCLPFLLPLALALLVAAFSALLKDFHAASGKYRFLPLLGFPSEVRHFCFPQSFKDRCDFLNGINLPLLIDRYIDY
tara:strand:+ start:2691 stop:3089 length:399 start_codon:yes stop_codon:yes gene_type:complete